MHEPERHQTVDRLERVDRMAASDGNPGLRAHRLSSRDDSLNHLDRHFSSGMPTMASAKIGLPPIAYTSESALVAAMRPKSWGSSTMGVKKSVVATIACSSFSRYTAASSLDSIPTSRSFGRPRIGVLARISERTAGAILQPQPPPWENCVRRMRFAGAFMCLPCKPKRALLPACRGLVSYAVTAMRSRRNSGAKSALLGHVNVW